MPERQVRALRLSIAGIAAVAEIAERDGLTWGEAARRLLAWATRPGRAMPPGWHLGKEQRRE